MSTLRIVDSSNNLPIEDVAFVAQDGGPPAIRVNSRGGNGTFEIGWTRPSTSANCTVSSPGYASVNMHLTLNDRGVRTVSLVRDPFWGIQFLQWWEVLAAPLSPPPRLSWGDSIVLDLSPNLAPSGMIEIVLTSQLRWGKWLTFPNGSGGFRTISTGAPWFGPLKSRDSAVVPASVAGAGNYIEFAKAGFWGVAKNCYKLGGLNIIAERTRLTFKWLMD